MGEMLRRACGRCVGVIGVDCVMLSVEESGWKNCTDVLDGFRVRVRVYR